MINDGTDKEKYNREQLLEALDAFTPFKLMTDDVVFTWRSFNSEHRQYITRHQACQLAAQEIRRLTK